MSQNREKATIELESKGTFIELEDSSRIFLNFDLQAHFNSSYKKTRFQFSGALKTFLVDNPQISICLTNDNDIKNFVKYENNWLVNIDDFIKFCNDIGYYRSDSRRVEAYFGQHISISNLSVSDQEKRDFLKSYVDPEDILFCIENLSISSKKELFDIMFGDGSYAKGKRDSLVSDSEFMEIFTRLLVNKDFRNSFFAKIPEIQIEVLEELRDFIQDNLDKNETFIQEWIDQDNGKYRSTRCMIFGIEYVDPKREGEILGRKRFDILATQNLENHVLIELKSPKADVFDIEERSNANGGVSTSYKLSADLSRAIPQILGYKKGYESMSKEDIERLGLSEKKSISDCIIVIGQREESQVWKENFQLLKNSLNIKIWTYNDLIDRMSNTIINLRENLK